MEHIYRTAGKPDETFMTKFGRYAGLLNIDEIDDAKGVWRRVGGELGVEPEELKKQVYRQRALYALGDHTRTLLVAIHDGALPSNVGGGYNLRTILRRCWSLIEEFGLDMELERLFELHIKEFGSWYTELKEEGSLWDILGVEKKRYSEGREKGRKMVEKMLSGGEEISAKKLVRLYDSHGISPELIREINAAVEVPENFYKMVEELHESSRTTKLEEKLELPDGLSETELMYYETDDTEFEAKVVKAFKDFVVLDRTLFFAEGGGQDHDLGTLNGVEVTDVQKAGGVTLHKVRDAGRFKEGMKVKGSVDAGRRRQLTQHHTSAHIVNASAREVLGPHVWQAGANKTVDSARLDVTHYKSVSDQELSKIEEKANRIIKKAVKIEKTVMKRNEAEEKYGFRLYQGGAVPGTTLRVVNIVGVDVEACGGTHLNNTREAEEIKLVSAKRIQDGVVRLEFKAGNAAKERSGEETELFRQCLSILEGVKVGDKKPDAEKMREAAKLLSVPVNQLPSTLEKFMKEYGENNRKLESLKQEPLKLEGGADITEASGNLFEAWKKQKKAIERQSETGAAGLERELERLFSSRQTVKHVTSNLDLKTLTEAAKKLTQKQGRLLVLVNEAGGKANVVVASSSSHNAGEVCSRLCAMLGGGGGGSPTLGMGGGKAVKVQETLDKIKI